MTSILRYPTLASFLFISATGSAGDGRLFLSFSCAEKSDTTGVLHACAIRSYDDKGSFVRESVVQVNDGTFGKKTLTLETVLTP